MPWDDSYGITIGRLWLWSRDSDGDWSAQYSGGEIAQAHFLQTEHFADGRLLEFLTERADRTQFNLIYITHTTEKRNSCTALKYSGYTVDMRLWLVSMETAVHKENIKTSCQNVKTLSNAKNVGLDWMLHLSHITVWAECRGFILMTTKANLIYLLHIPAATRNQQNSRNGTILTCWWINSLIWDNLFRELKWQPNALRWRSD